MTQKSVVAVLVALLLTSPCYPQNADRVPTPATGRRFVLRCGRILDVRSGKLLKDQSIVTEGNRIRALVPASQIGNPGEIIDLAAATCLPGLLDMHTHLIDGGTGSYNPARPLQRSGAQMAFDSIPHAKATLMAGFTTVRDVGTFRAFVDVALRDAIDAAVVPGPRMVPAGAYVTTTGGAGALNGFAPDIQLPLELRYGMADGSDQVRQRVRGKARQGKVFWVVTSKCGPITALGFHLHDYKRAFDRAMQFPNESEMALLKVHAVVCPKPLD
jgi:imidazolonepropionase-like amidohydrolase